MRGFRMGDRAPKRLLKGGSGSGGGGKSKGGGGGASAEGESKFNALGQEVEYAGVARDTSNSRLFEAQNQVKDLNGWRSLDADTQAGLIDSMTIQLQGRPSDSTFNKRANRDIATLWGNTRQEAKEVLARSTFSTDARTNSPTQQRIQRDVQRIRDQQAKARQRARTNSQPTQRDAFDDFFDSL